MGSGETVDQSPPRCSREAAPCESADTEVPGKSERVPESRRDGTCPPTQISMALDHTAQKGRDMSAEAKKGYGSTLALLLFGVLAFYLGARWLVLLIPAALLIWYGAGPMLRSGRN